MKRLIIVAALLLSFGFSGFCFAPHVDSLKIAALDSLAGRYVESLMFETVAVKESECAFMIESIADSTARTHLANKLYNLYRESPVMGDEEVAIFIWDQWFHNAKLRVIAQNDRTEEEEFVDRDIFAEFNRPTMIGEYAPVVKGRSSCGFKVRMPSKTKASVLFFYDTECGKCKVESKILPQVLENTPVKIVFYAFYTGGNRIAWKQWKQSFRVKNSKVKVVHLWDPEVDSDYLRLYGVIATPKLFVVTSGGQVLGRRLEVDNLTQLLDLL